MARRKQMTESEARAMAAFYAGQVQRGKISKFDVDDAIKKKCKSLGYDDISPIMVFSALNEYDLDDRW